MRETWLGPNRRILAMGMIAPCVLLFAGLWLVLGARAEDQRILRWLGYATVAVAAVPTGTLLYLWRQPRLALENRELLVYLSSTLPTRVPIENVECFFLGQGPTLLGGSQAAKAETATVVVRLAESAKDWKHRDVKPALGSWCDGYITIRGTWCEPLNATVVKRLNERLVAAQQRRRAEDGAAR